MSSEVANRFFQGKENVPLAIALGRVKLSGPPLTLLQLAPVTNPIHPAYRAWIEEPMLEYAEANFAQPNDEGNRQEKENAESLWCLSLFSRL